MSHTLAKTLLPVILASCSTGAMQMPVRQGPSLQVDHVLVGVPNLEAGIREFEHLTGVRAEIGGTHPGRGTRNALLSLGDGTYLELYAPNPAEEVDSETVRELKGLSGPTPVGWAVSTTDVEGFRAYYASLGVSVSTAEPGSRVRPDGSVLKWVTFGFDRIENPLVPFFIKWDQPDLHPSMTSPRGCRLLSLRLRDRNPSELKALVRLLGLNVPVDGAPSKQMEVNLSCPKGKIRLR